MTDYTITSKLWVWHSDTGKGSWHFLTIDGEIARSIRDAAAINRLELGLSRKRGWGSIKVEAQIGATVWRTSLFPNKQGAEYLLPVKAAVRKAEALTEGDVTALQLKLLL